jgi:hypothetical protein
VQPLDLMSDENRTAVIQAAFRRHEGEMATAPLPSSDGEVSTQPDTRVRAASNRKPARKSLLRRILEGG